MQPDRQLKRQLSGEQCVCSEDCSITRCETDRLSTDQTDTPGRPTSVWPELRPGQTSSDFETEEAARNPLSVQNQNICLMLEPFNVRYPWMERISLKPIHRNVLRSSKRAKHSNKSSTLSNHLVLVLEDGSFFEKGQSSPSFISRVQQETWDPTPANFKQRLKKDVRWDGEGLKPDPWILMNRPADCKGLHYNISF